MAETKQGNQCIFVPFILFNVFLVLEAFAIIGFSIYLFSLEDIKQVFEWGFLATGIALAILAGLSLLTKRSPGWLFFYLTLLFISFSWMCVQSILFFAMKG